MRHVECRHKADFGAAGLGTAQSWFWSRHKAGFGAVGLGSAQSRFWSRHKAGYGVVGLGSAQSWFWSRHQSGLGAVGLGSAQSWFWSRHKAGTSFYIMPWFEEMRGCMLIYENAYHLMKQTSWYSPKQNHLQLNRAHSVYKCMIQFKAVSNTSKTLAFNGKSQIKIRYVNTQPSTRIRPSRAPKIY